ncbi:MAG: alpha/beta hydrolase [Gammaproteobacteria bacterium]|nr:alpha/beta hydrolase [Gammaproteobacteria bacterium]
MSVLQLTDGGLLEYDNEGSGQAIVFLHGWSLGNEAFGPQRRYFSGTQHVVSPCLRGHGDSSPFEKRHSIETLASDVSELLVELEVADAVLVGWSMGALVAWQIALGKERARVAGIVTIDMVPRVLNGDDWSHGLRAGAHLYDVDIDVSKMRTNWQEFTRAYVPKVFASGKSEERRELISKMTTLIADNDVGSMTQLWQAIVNADFVDQVQTLDVPTMITYGQLSQVYDEPAAMWMEQHIPNSRRVAFAESGHAPHLEEPRLFNQALEQFIGELNAPDSI